MSNDDVSPETYLRDRAMTTEPMVVRRGDKTVLVQVSLVRRRNPFRDRERIVTIDISDQIVTPVLKGQEDIGLTVVVPRALIEEAKMPLAPGLTFVGDEIRITQESHISDQQSRIQDLAANSPLAVRPARQLGEMPLFARLVTNERGGTWHLPGARIDRGQTAAVLCQPNGLLRQPLQVVALRHNELQNWTVTTKEKGRS